MAQKSGFFNAQQSGTGVYDRIYYAEDFASAFNAVVGTGVVEDGDGNSLNVTANVNPDLTVNVSSGKAFVNGYWYDNSANVSLSIDYTSSTQQRIDAICLGLNLETREISLYVVEGSASSSSPVAPIPVRSETKYELFIAYVTMPANASSVISSYISDTRADTTVCGKIPSEKLITEISDNDIDAIIV